MIVRATWLLVKYSAIAVIWGMFALGLAILVTIF